MPSKRQPSKQRKAVENRAKRQALQARTVHANEPRPVASKTTSSSTTATGKGSTAGKGKGGSLLSGGKGTPGERAMTMALAFVPFSILAYFILKIVNVDDRGDVVPTSFRGLYIGARDVLTDGTSSVESVSTWSANGPITAISFVVPSLVVIGAYYAFRRQPTGRTLTIAMLALAFTVILGGGTFFLPSLIAIGVASFQVRKAEMLAAQQEVLADAQAEIDAEEAEDAEYDDEEDEEDLDGEYDEEDEYDDEDLDEEDDEEDEYEDGDVYDDPDAEEDPDTVEEEEEKLR